MATLAGQAEDWSMWLDLMVATIFNLLILATVWAGTAKRTEIVAVRDGLEDHMLGAFVFALAFVFLTWLVARISVRPPNWLGSNPTMWRLVIPHFYATGGLMLTALYAHGAPV